MSTPSAQAKRLLETSIVIDGLGGSLIYPSPRSFDGRPYLDLVREAGITAMNVTMVSEPGYNSELVETLHAFFFNYRLIETNPDRLLLVETAADIERAHREGKTGVILSLQSAWVLGMDRTLVTILHKLGMRILQLTYMERNNLGSGCFEPVDLGLTSFGKQVVREMNRLGMVVDLSHGGYKTTMDAIEASSDPCVFTHANVRALTDHPRNLAEDQIQACARRGGVIGLTPYAAYNEPSPGVRPTVEHYLDHVAHMIDKAGIDHVGIGTDFFEGKTAATWLTNSIYPEFKSAYASVDARRAVGFERIDEIGRVVDGLMARGFGEADVAKVLGGNFLRVFREVWGA
jgi:membrane dipeptidase